MALLYSVEISRFTKHVQMVHVEKEHNDVILVDLAYHGAI